MPDLSVVIPSVNGFADLEGCLQALEAQRADHDLEVLVIDRLGSSLRGAVHVQFPLVRTIEVPSTTSIPEMRAIGIRAATAPAVGILEDHVLVRPGWASAMLGAIREGAEVVGGSVENAATDTVIDWASFLCEYSHCLPPLPAGEVDWLTGNNVVYRRDLLERHFDVIDRHGWEVDLHEAIKAGGTPLVCRPDIVVDHKKHFTLGEYLELRYNYSRSYAGARLRGAGRGKRAVYALAGLALPPVLFYRTVSRILAKGRHRDWLVRGAPAIAVFVVAWAWGEIVGYWAGPGDSLQRVT